MPAGSFCAGGELTINTTTKVMKGKKVLFTYAKPKTFKFTKASVTLKRGTANTDLSSCAR